MDEYLTVTVRSRPTEPTEAFNLRLIAFWSAMIRRYPDEYKRVYAETTRFGPDGNRVTRQYLVGTDVAELLTHELIASGIELEPVDTEDVYSKYEATPPEWYQIPH